MSKKRAARAASHALRYVGEGRYLGGIPARDLSPDEAARFDEDALVASGLYRVAEGRGVVTDDRSRALPAFTEAASASAADDESADLERTDD